MKKLIGQKNENSGECLSEFLHSKKFRRKCGMTDLPSNYSTSFIRGVLGGPRSSLRIWPPPRPNYCYFSLHDFLIIFFYPFNDY